MLLSSQLSSDPSARIITIVNPFPLTQDQQTLNSSLIAVLTSIGFAFIPASFAAWVVKERTTKAKHQQMISGMFREGFCLFVCVVYVVYVVCIV